MHPKLRNLTNMTYYLLYAFIAVLAIQMAGFAYGYSRQSDKITDLLYGLTFMFLGWWAILYTNNEHYPALFLLAFICMWSLRISTYLFMRIHKMKRDQRFDGFRKKFWGLLGFWLLQTISIWIIMLPSLIYFAKSYPATILNNFISVLGSTIFIMGFTIETFADHQKFTFKSNPENKGKFIQSGLWKLSRHPNYFGEILCWSGIFIYCTTVLQGLEWLSIISPLWISFLLLKVSGIPLLEKKQDEKYGNDPEYQKYKKDTNSLIPSWKKID